MFDARVDVRGLRDGGHRKHERRLSRVPGARGDAHGVENRGSAREAREPLEGRGAVLRGDRDVAVPRRARRAAEPERSVSATAAPLAASAVATEPAAAAEVAAAGDAEPAAAEGDAATATASPADAPETGPAAATAGEPAPAAVPAAPLRRFIGPKIAPQNDPGQASSAAAGAKRRRGRGSSSREGPDVPSVSSSGGSAWRPGTRAYSLGTLPRFSSPPRSSGWTRCWPRRRWGFEEPPRSTATACRE